MSIGIDAMPVYWRARARVRRDADDFIRASDYEAIADKLEARVPLAAIPEFQAETRRIVTWAKK